LINNEYYISTHRFIPLSRTPLKYARDLFTAVSKYGGGGIEDFHETDTHFGIPIYSDYGREFSYQDLRVSGNHIDWKFTSTLRPNQKTISREFDKHVMGGREGFILEAPPGAGKTVLTLKMLEMLERLALVVVPKTDLVHQWVERATQHTSLKESEIGVISGTRFDDPTDKKLFIGLVHSLALDRMPEGFKESIGVLVFDEVDRSLPPATFSPVISLFPARYKIGCSATTYRKDGLHQIFEHHLGQVRLKGQDEGRMKPKVLVYRYNPSSGFVYPTPNKLNKRGMLLSRLAENPERNALIARLATDVHTSGRRQIIISDRTEQLSGIKEILMERHNIPETDIGFYARSVTALTGQKRTVSNKEMKETADNAKIILASYGMMKMGTDIPDAACLILATPQSDMVQTQGRIERLAAGKKQPVVIDIIDTFYPETMGWYYARKRHYEKCMLEVKEVNKK